MKKLFILDASGYLYSSYFAIRNMTNHQGESTNALFGFARALLKLFKDFDVSHVVAVFDGPNNAQKRKEIYPEYKAHRSETPKDLPYQIDWARELCDYIGVPLLNIPNVEADDTMGCVAQWAATEGYEVYICTTDKDMCQVVNDQVFLLNTRKENLKIGPKEVEEIHGVPPNQIIDFLSIIGDASDNIPGLPGIGPKGAIALLKQFGSLDEILKHPEQISGDKKQAIIKEHGDTALLSRRLVSLDLSVDIPHDPSFYLRQPSNIETLKPFYGRMNFHSLIKELGEVTIPTPKEIKPTGTETNPQEKATNPKVEVDSFFEHGLGLVHDLPQLYEQLQEKQYLLVDDEKNLERLEEKIKNSTEVAIKTLCGTEKELVGIAFCIDAICWYVPMQGQLGKAYISHVLKPLLEDSSLHFFGYDIKADFHALKQLGITLATLSFDVLLASYILNAHDRQHSLEALSLRHFNHIKKSLDELCGKGKHFIAFAQQPPETLCYYCCEDVDLIFQLKNILTKEIETRGLAHLFYTIELPLIPILAKMEEKGIYVDTQALKEFSTYLNMRLTTLQQEIYALAGETFNINSPKQLSQILQEKLNIVLPKKTATGFSTNADVLESLVEKHPIAQLLLDYRSLEKLRSTYAESLPNDINPSTHRIHCTFNQSVAATGRLSCQNPNLQNIPVRTEEGRKIREAFRPEKEDWVYLSADYSQIELRLLAHFSEDSNLMTAFHRGEDIHSYTAATIFQIPLEQVTQEMRYQAKAVNFGIVYGQQAFGLAKELGIPVKKAAEFIEMYFARYPKIKEVIETYKETARATGKATTLTGRERLIPEINSKNGQLRSFAERLAINTPLQGSAADLIKLAMLKIDRELQLQPHAYQGYLILQIHDELIFEIPKTEVEFFHHLVKKAMEEAVVLKVPLVVDIHVGKNWKEC